ncbi:MAG: hypothetical protein WC346_07855 [Methanogenium sp.]|jgi:acylphosphatase
MNTAEGTTLAVPDRLLDEAVVAIHGEPEARYGVLRRVGFTRMAARQAFGLTITGRVILTQEELYAMTLADAKEMIFVKLSESKEELERFIEDLKQKINYENNERQNNTQEARIGN